MFTTTINPWTENDGKYLYWLNSWQYSNIKEGISCKIIDNELFKYLGYHFIITDKSNIGIFTFTKEVKRFDDSKNFYEEFYRFFNIEYKTLKINEMFIPLWDYDYVKGAYVYVVSNVIYEDIKDVVEVFEQAYSPFNYIHANIKFIWNNKNKIKDYVFDTKTPVGICMYNLYEETDDIHGEVIDPFNISDMTDFYIPNERKPEHRYIVYTHYDEIGNIYLKNHMIIYELLNNHFNDKYSLHQLLLYGEILRLNKYKYFRDLDMKIDFKSHGLFE